MFEYLDDISEIVYIADLETYELYYLNDSGKRIFGVENIEGCLCYRVLQNRESPCPFCTNAKLCVGENYTWEHSNPVSGNHYLLKDRLVEWNGKPARLEIAFDTTESERGKIELRQAMDAESMVLQCTHELYRATNVHDASNDMLAQIGEYFQSKRTYIFEYAENHLDNTYEWCAPGVESELTLLQGLDFDLVADWQESFDRGECVIIEDIKDIKETQPRAYDLLTVQNIKSLAAAPLEQEGRVVGFIGIDDPPPDRIRNITSLLQTLGYFYLMTVQRITNAERLTHLSFHDELTGLYNRNRYISDVEDLEGYSGPIGVVYLDVNNLKTINDRFGHSSGDETLCLCADTMTRVLKGSQSYRVGGDEFVAIVRGVDEDRFNALVAAFEREMAVAVPDERLVSLGKRWSTDGADVEAMLVAADAEMYERKRAFHLEQALAGMHPEPPDVSTSALRPIRMEDGALLGEYNMLMSALHVSVSKHLMTEKFEVVWANDFYYEMTGYTREEYETLFNNNVGDYFANDLEEYETIGSAVQAAIEAGEQGYECFAHMPVKGGGYMWIHVVGMFTNEQINGIPVIYATFTSVNDVVRMERERSITYDNIPGFVARYRVTPEGIKLLYGNERFINFFGPIDDPESNALLRENLAFNDVVIGSHYPHMLEGESVAFEVEAKSVRNERGFFKVYADCIDWEDGDPIYLVLYLDMTELDEQRRLAEDTMEQLRSLAYVDAVTGGRNRASFDKDAGEAVRSVDPGTYALVALDVEKFKVINDQFGLAEGDAVLKMLYERISARLEEGEYVARISADLFNVLMRVDDEDSMAARIEAMAVDANAGLSFGGVQSYVLTMTAGICVIDEPDLPMMQLQDRANVARKKARSERMSQLSSCRFYSNDDRLRLAQEKDIENRMRDALDAGEFVVFLQPKLDLRHKAVAGAEALVRWKDPLNGLVGPNEFIPLFERNGFIVDLDLHVFEQVCAQLRSWISSHRHPLPISVNLSRMHLFDENFLDRFEEIRCRYDVPASLIEFELTETLVFGNPQLLSSVIDRIHRAGYACSMDDFGSGYSSLNVLKDLEVDALKLDRVFFDAPALDDERAVDIIRIVVELAQRLHMQTIAEGVETEAQRRFLEEVGCDMIQGYLFSPPVPPDEFEHLVFGRPDSDDAS